MHEGLKKTVRKYFPLIRNKLKGKLVEISVVDHGVVGVSLQLELWHNPETKATMSCMLAANAKESEVKAEVDHLITEVINGNFDRKIDLAIIFGEQSDAGAVLINDIPGKSLAEAVLRFAEKGINFDQMMQLVQLSQIDPAVLHRLDAFLDQGADDDFSDLLRPSGTQKPRTHD
jgi:hypothetical protein